MKHDTNKFRLLSLCAVFPLCLSACAAGGIAGERDQAASAVLIAEESAGAAGQDSDDSSSGEGKAVEASGEGTSSPSSLQGKENTASGEGEDAASTGEASSDSSTVDTSSFYSGRNRWYGGDYKKYTKEDYDLAVSFCTDGYQDQTVAEFDRSFMDWDDEAAYHKMEDILKSLHYGIPEDDPYADFIYGTLSNAWDNCERKHYETCERKKNPWYNGYSVFETFGDVYGDQVCLTGAYADFNFDYEITDENVITVGERDAILSGVEDALTEFMSGQPAQKLRDEDTMEKTLEAELEKRLKTIGDGKLSWGGGCSLSYWWDAPWEEWYSDDEAKDNKKEEEEALSQKGYTQEQYQYVLERLKFNNYKEMPVAEFDRMINGLFSSYDEEWDKFQKAFEKVYSYMEGDDPAYSFLHDTVQRAQKEYDARVRTVYSGKECDPEEAGWISLERTEDVFGDAVTVGMLEGDYVLTYRVLDADKLTVGQRDRFFEEVESFTKDALREAMEAGEADESTLKKAMMQAGEKAAIEGIMLTDCEVDYLGLME